MSKLQLGFGYGDAVPEGALAAWGARAIIQGTWSGGFSLDVPHDRISFAGEVGPKATLIEKLKAVDPVKLAEGYLSQDAPQNEPLPIYEDAEVKAVGRMAGGYFYLAAYLKPEQPGIVLPRTAPQGR